MSSDRLCYSPLAPRPVLFKELVSPDQKTKKEEKKEVTQLSATHLVTFQTPPKKKSIQLRRLPNKELPWLNKLPMSVAAKQLKCKLRWSRGWVDCVRGTPGRKKITFLTSGVTFIEPHVCTRTTNSLCWTRLDQGPLGNPILVMAILIGTRQRSGRRNARQWETPGRCTGLLKLSTTTSLARSMGSPDAGTADYLHTRQKHHEQSVNDETWTPLLALV